MTALNQFASSRQRLLPDEQLIDHIEMFTNDVVNPRIDDKLRGGIGTPMNDQQAMAKATMLQARMSGIDGAKDVAPKMRQAMESPREDDAQSRTLQGHRDGGPQATEREGQA